MAIGKKRLLFVMSSLFEGGTERVITDIIRSLDKEKHEIHLALFEKRGPYLSHIPNSVKVYDLKKINRYSFFKLVFRLIGLFQRIKPDTVVSFANYTNSVVFLAKFFSGGKFTLLTSVRTHLSLALEKATFGRTRFLLNTGAFKYSDIIVVPSLGVKEDLERHFKIDPGKIKIIYNPIDLEKIKRLKEEPAKYRKNEENSPYIMTIGRLTKQKGYPYLLQAFSRIHKEIKEKLFILGTGEDEGKIKALTERLGIQDAVFFWGFQKNPYAFMNNASLFVLPSLWEGFPNVVLEAMACGVPVVSTDCPSGPSEIITHGKDGLLVPPADENALAGAMLTLLRDENLRERFSEEGIKKVENLKIERILKQYEELF